MVFFQFEVSLDALDASSEELKEVLVSCLSSRLFLFDVIEDALEALEGVNASH